MDSALSVSDGGKLLVKIYADGTIEYGEGYTPDEAAKTFWNAIAYHHPLREQTLLEHAAPDMLNVLHRINANFSRLQSTDEEADIFKAIDAAIAKATGKTP